MSKINVLCLKLKEADEADFGKSLVRIHETNKPQDTEWGDYIDISLDKKRWITSKLEPSGNVGVGKIYIGIHIRGLLRKDSILMQPFKLEAPFNFYIRKAAHWKTILYNWIGI